MATKTILWTVGGTVIGAAALAAGLVAGNPERWAGGAAATLSSPTGEEASSIEAVVRNYLLTHPEVLMEAQSVLASREQDRQRLAVADVLQSEQAALYESPHDGVIGNPEASTTVVEFFDYNCGYCKQALGDMEAMVEADPDLRFVIKEFPILGPDSQAAHIVSAALQRIAPDKYPDFHIRLLGSEGRADEASALALALELGVEERALREAMRDPSVMDAFSQTYELASKLQISGTPAYVIGDEVVFGALGAAALTQHVEAARN